MLCPYRLRQSPPLGLVAVPSAAAAARATAGPATSAAATTAGRGNADAPAAPATPRAPAAAPASPRLRPALRAAPTAIGVAPLHATALLRRKRRHAAVRRPDLGPVLAAAPLDGAGVEVTPRRHRPFNAPPRPPRIDGHAAGARGNRGNQRALRRTEARRDRRGRDAL